MELHIQNGTTIKDLQKQFNGLYPFLQLDFYKAAAADSRYVKKAEKLSPELEIKPITFAHEPVSVSLEQKITVAELVKSFQDLGLLAQVCRKSGNHWVETSLTGDWTLERQNTEAMLINISEYKSTSKGY